MYLMHTILIAADQKNKGNISPTWQVHFIVVVVVKLYLNTLPSSPMDVFHEGRHTNYI